MLRLFVVLLCWNITSLASDGDVAPANNTQSKANITKAASPNEEINLNFNKPLEMESGALFRGVLVLVAITILIIIYMAIKTYYRRRSKPVIVRKYGVRTNRSDIEMTPLPLDEDDDDETLFELNKPR